MRIEPTSIFISLVSDRKLIESYRSSFISFFCCFQVRFSFSELLLSSGHVHAKNCFFQSNTYYFIFILCIYFFVSKNVFVNLTPFLCLACEWSCNSLKINQKPGEKMCKNLTPCVSHVNKRRRRGQLRVVGQITGGILT